MAELDEIGVADGRPTSGTGEVPTLAPVRDAVTALGTAIAAVETAVAAVETAISGSGFTMIAHDAVDSGEPLKIGGYAKATAPTAVVDGDRVNAWFRLDGSQSVADSAVATAVAAVEVAVDAVETAIAGSGFTMVAHDAVDSGEPLKIGGYAKATAPANVADADRVNAWFLLNGSKVVTLSAAGALIGGDATTGLFVGGAIAHDAADTGNPQKIGGRARNAEITAVANNDRVDAVFDLAGKQIVLPYANPENFTSGVTAAMTGTTSTSLLPAPAAGLRNYITTLIVSNSHATIGTDIVIQDGSGGTTLAVIPAAALYGGAAITLPTPLRQPTTATAIFCANVTTGASTRVSAVGYKGV